MNLSTVITHLSRRTGVFAWQQVLMRCSRHLKHKVRILTSITFYLPFFCSLPICVNNKFVLPVAQGERIGGSILDFSLSLISYTWPVSKIS